MEESIIIYFYIDNPKVFDFIELVDFDYEANLPSFYSSLAILFCAILLWLISLQKQTAGLKYRYHWLGLAFIFTFLGLDEAIALHEEVGDFVEELNLFEASGYLYFAWVVPYGILLILFALTYLKFVLSLPKTIMLKFICAGLMFIGGAVGLEVISAREADLHGSETVYYSILYCVNRR